MRRRDARSAGQFNRVRQNSIEWRLYDQGAAKTPAYHAALRSGRHFTQQNVAAFSHDINAFRKAFWREVREKQWPLLGRLCAVGSGQECLNVSVFGRSDVSDREWFIVRKKAEDIAAVHSISLDVETCSDGLLCWVQPTHGRARFWTGETDPELCPGCQQPAGWSGLPDPVSVPSCLCPVCGFNYETVDLSRIAR